MNVVLTTQPPLAAPERLDSGALAARLVRHLAAVTGKDPHTATRRDWFFALANLVRELTALGWVASRRDHDRWTRKRIYYLSMEFLLGRLLTDALHNLALHETCREALAGFGLDLEDVAAEESDAALGNGGLGRFAACLMEAMATLGVPAYGYGLRFEYGLFTQKIDRGWQIEKPEHWLRHGNPWEYARTDVVHRVSFQGRPGVEGGAEQRPPVASGDVFAMAYDVPIPGYRSRCVNTLRLWSAKAQCEFDTATFHRGDHLRAVEDRAHWENLTRVLYPNDVNDNGRELRFKQEFFFASASIQDILAEYARAGLPLGKLPDKVSIHINDTHPAFAVTELVRLLMDGHGLDFDPAWRITRRTVSYTNHTLMPEALETWPVRFFEAMLPRHLEIVYRINERLIRAVRRRVPGDPGFSDRLSLVDERGERRVRMAHLAFAGSHRVNGVSELHTDLMRRTVFADFVRLYPRRIVNVTNGVAPRRWLASANPSLAALITSCIGETWLGRLEELERLAPFADDAAFRRAFRSTKRNNKLRFARHALERCGAAPDPESMFDVQVKRIHEYKRQLLKLLHVVTSYNRIRSGSPDPAVARTVVFAGKAAPGYATAKLIVKLIHDVGEVVNADAAADGRLKVMFVPNYGVSEAEVIIPAADLSEQISTAGTEASGTGNMKLALNGALTIGTLDGANVEIADAVGRENFFAFGMHAEEAARLRREGYDPGAVYRTNDELKGALDLVAEGFFSRDEPERFRPLVDALLSGGDPFLVLADYESYIECQARVDALYRDAEEWTRRAILNVSRLGHFSSDRAAREYATRIWNVTLPAERA